MARDLRLLHARIERPDERAVPLADRRGPHVVLSIQSADLKYQPVHDIELTDDEAVKLIGQLAQALMHKQGKGLHP